MVVETIRPNENIATEWGLFGYGYTYINEEVWYPDLSGATGSYIAADGYVAGDNNDVITFGMTMPTGFISGNSISQISVYTQGTISDPGIYPEVSISWDTGDSWSSEYNATGWAVDEDKKDLQKSATWDWRTWSSLSKNYDDLSKLYVRIRADVPDNSMENGDVNIIVCMYADVTFLTKDPSTPSGVAGWASVSGQKKICWIKR